MRISERKNGKKRNGKNIGQQLPEIMNFNAAQYFNGICSTFEFYISIYMFCAGIQHTFEVLELLEDRAANSIGKLTKLYTDKIFYYDVISFSIDLSRQKGNLRYSH